jgi:uncharacterized membrane protein YedE/YeeE
MKRLGLVVSFVSGVLFAAGLAVSGMTHPSKVIGFLDFTGDWDPSLMFVICGAIGVHVFFAQRALRKMRAGGRPLLADSFALPTSTQVDARLLGGAVLFGAGWGLAGYCPGPALVSLAHLAPAALAFVGAMAVGMLVASRFDASTSNSAAARGAKLEIDVPAR